MISVFNNVNKSGQEQMVDRKSESSASQRAPAQLRTARVRPAQVRAGQWKCDIFSARLWNEKLSPWDVELKFN